MPEKKKAGPTGSNSAALIFIQNLKEWQPGGESREGADEVCRLVRRWKVVQLDHVTKLVNVDGGVACLEGAGVYILQRIYIFSTKLRLDRVVNFQDIR